MPRTPPDDAPTGPLVDYLKTRDVTVFEGSDDLNRNEAFEHLARHLGTHFDLLSPFYEKMKRCVATGRGQRIDIDHFSDQERSAAVQFGTLLHRHGMLKDFYYHRSPKKQLRVIPTKDGQTGQFLTGGWLEIYVSLQLWRRLKAHYSPAKFQMLYNVKGTLPDGREFESDLMANVDGRMFWLECKTGHWQDYAARFKGLVKTFGVDRESSALLLIRPPDQSTRQRATDMLDMTLLSLSEVDAFINGFLGVEDDGESGDDEGMLPVGVIPPLSDDEIPLENAEPARKLGRVDLGGGSKSEDSEEDGEGSGGRRRKRRRRGGRGRGRSRDTEGQKQESGADKPPSSLRELLPIESDARAAEAQSGGGDAPAEVLADVPAEMVADTSVAKGDDGGDGESQASAAPDGDEDAKPKRSRGRRGGRGRRRSGGERADGGDDADESVSKSEATDDQPQASEDAKSAVGEDEGEDKGEDGKRPRRRRARKSPFAVDEDAAEAAEKAETSGASDEQPEPEPEPEPAMQAEAAEEEAEDEEPEPRTSPKGVVIAPDLAAMMAGSKKKADDE